jgi:hypothetical protein
VICSSQDHLKTGMRDLDNLILAGVENIDRAARLAVDQSLAEEEAARLIVHQSL